MRPTRRYWAVGWLAVLLAVAAAAFDRPALLLGTAALGGWLVAAAFAFLRTVTAVDGALDIEVTLSADGVVDDDVEVTLRAAELGYDAPTTVTLRLPSGLPTTATPEERRIELSPDAAAETTLTVDTPVAGRFTLPQPDVTVTDPRGLLEQAVRRGPTPSVTVEPRYPRDLSIGAGDRQFTTVAGRHAGEVRGQGLQPAEIRKYVPGETIDRIDWNATARLDETYVRTFETQTAIETAFVVDARSETRTGPEGETALDYLREVALGLLGLARSYEDPAGLAIVDDDGLAFLQQPTNSPGGYDRARSQLLALPPEEHRRRSGRHLDSGSALADRLARVDGDSAFVRTLSACIEARHPLPADRSPLRSAIRGIDRRTEGRIVLFTDDTNRREIRDVVDEARRTAEDVTVFLAPTVLYEAGSLADLPSAYERYADFETFRRNLDRLEGVTAFEVGPGDRRERLRGASVAETA
jgi:uncharacterized protein (DUF58 family)